MMYNMTVRLEMNDFVEADSPEEAFEILSTDAIYGGSWEWWYEEIEENEEEE